MPSKKINIAVLGAGNMGTTLANIIANNGYTIRLWNYEGDPEPLQQIKEFRENKKYVPGLTLSTRIIPEVDLEQAIREAHLVIFAIPSAVLVTTVERASAYVKPNMVVVDVSKGFREMDFEEKPKVPSKVKKIFKDMVIISGPAVAADLAQGGFTAMNIAARNTKHLTIVKKIIENQFVKLIPTTDVVGIKLCGALKNVYAILLGMCDGLGFTLNTKSFLVTLAIEEMTRLSSKLGGKSSSAMSLSGLGDLIGTGLSLSSRNRRFGELLICAESKESAEREVGQVVEGIRACNVARNLAHRYRVRIPLIDMIYRITWQGKSPQSEIQGFLKKFKV